MSGCSISSVASLSIHVRNRFHYTILILTSWKDIETGLLRGNNPNAFEKFSTSYNRDFWILSYIKFHCFKHTALVVSKNNLIKTIPKITKNFAVSFEVKPTGKLNVPWSSILHFTATGDNCCKVGDRVPGLWFKGNTNNLHICFPVGDVGNTCIDTKEIASDKGTVVSIEQRSVEGSYKTIVTVGGDIVATKTHEKEPAEFTNVKVYASDPWHPAAKAEVKNLEFKNLGMSVRLRGMVAHFYFL